MAKIGWIDFSTNDRNRVGSVLDSLRPEGLVDELGVGTIRDALSNQLFPGISTIQTRARYFFIVPYILYDYQIAKPSQRRNKTASRFLEEKEYDIMWYLGEKYDYQEGHGVIGITKKKPNKIIRRPSAIYWKGLYTYNFIDTGGLAADSFLKQSANRTIMESLLSSMAQGDDSRGDDIDAEYENLFKIKVAPKLDWKDDLDLELQKDEAEFFQDRIISIAGNKLIAELLQNENLWNVFILSKDFMQFSTASLNVQFSKDIEDMIILAQNFSELMYGAHLAYNCQIQKMVFNNEEFGEEFQEWIDNIKTMMIDYSGFNPDDLFIYANTTRKSTVQFVKEWWKHTQNGFPDLTKRDTLIRNQEAHVKGAKARLQWNKTDDVQECKWIGLQYFDFRFPQARTILQDIKTGILR